MRKFSKRTIAVTAVAVALGGAGVAYAAWTVNGYGSAGVQAANVVDLQVDPVTLTGELIPGGAADLEFEVYNPNTFAVEITDVTVDYQHLQVDRAHTACAKRNIVSTNVQLEDGFVLAADTRESLVMDKAIMLAENAGDECIGAQFTIPLIVHGQSTVVEESSAPTDDESTGDDEYGDHHNGDHDGTGDQNGDENSTGGHHHHLTTAQSTTPSNS